MSATIIALAAASAAVPAAAATVALAMRRRAVALVARLADQEAAAEAMREREAAYRGVAEEQAALRRVAVAVAERAAPNDVFDLVAEEAARLLAGHAGQVCRFAGWRAMVVGAWGDGALTRDGWFSMQGSAVMSRVAQGDATRVDDYGALSGRDPRGTEVMHPSQYGAIAAPIRVGSELWGAILVVTSAPLAALAPGAEARLARFAQLVTLAIAAAEERDLLHGLATTDTLTGLANRRAFDARIAAEIDRARRHGTPLSLVLMDIDHFKRINDRWGHQVGDDVLVEFARRLQAQARGSDLVARIGGEEFAWILPDTPVDGAGDAADRARRTVADTPFPAAGAVTCSAGVSDAGAAGFDAAEIVRLADTALYAAKRAGRDTVRVADPVASTPPR
ncbi:MAG: GGDEF domain-containing protein [Actinomycetota bacterium]